MDSGLEQQMLPSIRRLQILLIYPTVEWTTRRPAFAISFPDAVVVVGQVAHFNLTPEASLCRGFYLQPFVLSKGWQAQMETLGQFACSVGRPARSVFRCRARLRAPWILGWKNANCPQSADHKHYWFTHRWSGQQRSIPPYVNSICYGCGVAIWVGICLCLPMCHPDCAGYRLTCTTNNFWVDVHPYLFPSMGL